MLYWKQDIEEVIDRYRKINRPGCSGALIQVIGIHSLEEGLPQVRPLKEWDFDADLPAFIDANLAHMNAQWSRRTALMDDAIPSLYPRFGIAEHSAYLGGEVIVEETTSYPVPFLHDLRDAEEIRPDPESRWFHYVMEGMDLIRERGAGKIAPRLRGGCSPADLANFVRGNALFTDFYDDPEGVRRLLEKCTEAEGWFLARQLDRYEPFYGGILEGMGIWLPEGAAGHLSEDWSYMCSAEMYREFGRPYTEKLAEPYTEVLMHLHGGGAHVIPEVAAIPKITYIQIVQDPNQPAPAEILRRYEKELRDKVVVLVATPREVQENVDLLRGRRTILQVETGTLEEAQELTAFVRRELPLEE